VRYLAALRPEAISESCLFRFVSLISQVACSSDNLPLLSLVLTTSLLYPLMLTIANFNEPFNSLARLEAIQINKTPCSVHWLPDLLRPNILIDDISIPRFNSGLFSLVALFSYIQGQ